MKQTLVLFLFLFSIIPVVFPQESDSFFQDSIIYYYDLSKGKKRPTEEKLNFIDKSIQFASVSNHVELYLKSLSRKSSVYYEDNDYDNAIKIALLLKKEAIKFNNKQYKGITYRKLGLYAKKKGDLIDALQSYQNSYEEYLIMGDSIKMGNVLRSIASIQNDLGVYSDAENSAIKSLKYLKGKDNSDLPWIYNALGRASKEKEDFNEAIEWYKKGLKVEESELSRAAIRQNIAVVLIKQNRFDEAVSILTALEKMPKIIDDEETYAKIKRNLAFAKIKLNKPEAEQGLLEAYEIQKRLEDNRGLFSSCILLSNFYKELFPDLALKYAKEANSIARIIKSPDAELEALSSLIFLSSNAESKKYGIRYTNLNDSLIREKNKIRQKYASYAYNLEEVEKEKAQKDLQISESQNRNLLLGFGILLVSLISVVVYYIQKQKAKQKLKLSQLQERYQTETRLSKKVHDEVGNDIFYLITQLENDPSLLEKNGLKILDGLQNIYSKARDISREYTDIDTGDGFPEELLSLLNSFGNKEIKIITKQLEPTFWTAIDADLKSEVFRIVQELLTNMKKHSQASVAAVTFKKEAQKLIIQYSDNGIGTNDEKLTLKSVENRIQVLQGVLTLDAQPDEGLQVSIIIPL